jgi:hypothetical protein
MTIHVDGLGHQPATVERVPGPARESGEATQPGRDEAIEIPGLDQAHRTVAQGDVAPGRRRTR